MIPKFAARDSPFVSRFVCNFNFPPALFAIRHCHRHFLGPLRAQPFMGDTKGATLRALAQNNRIRLVKFISFQEFCTFFWLRTHKFS